MRETLQTQILVVGGGTGGTAAAIQAARRGAQVVLVSEFPWLGGMLTSAGVSAPDGNELEAFQTGLWGAFLRELRLRQPGGLDNAWVSFFTYDPRVGAEIFADWVKALPNLHWIVGQVPRAVLRKGDRLLGVEFDDYRIEAEITLDGTELGDLLALGDVPHRWGWEPQEQWQEPSAPSAADLATDPFYQRYPVQAPTWVVLLQDFGSALAPEIPAVAGYDDNAFAGAWDKHGPEAFITYGRLPGDLYMINWPGIGNDYGEGLQRLLQGKSVRQAFDREALNHSQAFARYIQQNLGRRYGLAEVFPRSWGLGGGAFAFHPYFRESRRLIGQTTVTEGDILPQAGGCVAALSVDAEGRCTALAIGNYPNDHHYPGRDYRLAPKSLRWGGRWTGTPFALPYGCLVPETIQGLMVCEKNISVSHMANGATRLQPVVLGLGQAAGMAAALCLEQKCMPQELPIRVLQEALLSDSLAPASVIPLFNLPPWHPEWAAVQQSYLDQPETYPPDGSHPRLKLTPKPLLRGREEFVGRLTKQSNQLYQFHSNSNGTWQLVTVSAEVDAALKQLEDGDALVVTGQSNPAGDWVLVENITIPSRNAKKYYS
jgi:hypothetical protein